MKNLNIWLGIGGSLLIAPSLQAQKQKEQQRLERPRSDR